MDIQTYIGSIPQTKLSLSLEEYYTIAKKLIIKVAPRFRAGLVEELLSSDDALSNIVTAIMVGDTKFNGKGNIYGYRKQCAIWAIKSYLSRKKDTTLSLEVINEANSGSIYQERETTNPLNILINKEQVQIINELLGSGILSQKEETYIRQHIWHNKSFAKIAQESNVSRQAVQNGFIRGLIKLKGLVNE